jgi:trans-aconitate methyltransferase
MRGGNNRSRSQSWNPERYAKNAAFVPELGTPVLELLAPRPDERILDLGCGDGVLTQRLAETGASVVGVDASPEQVAAARQLGLDARVMDGAELEFESEFDAVFSNAALHWMPRSRAVIANVWRALKAGGRFVGEMGGEGNVEAIRSALSDALERRSIDGDALFPWYFPAPAEYRRSLEEAGFTVRSMRLLPRPTTLPTGIDGWLETFGESFLSALPEAGRPAFLNEVRERLEPRLKDADGRWVAEYVRLRFVACKEGEG